MKTSLRDHGCVLLRSTILRRNGHLAPPGSQWLLNFDRFVILMKLNNVCNPILTQTVNHMRILFR